MTLNYRLQVSKNISKTIPIVMIHGLFGDLNNLRAISTHLNQYHDVIQVDLRNHGRSFQDQTMTYIIMAQDILNTLNHLEIKQCIVIGHSMGGKIAMTLGIIAHQYIKKIVVIDIAPITYHMKRYNNLFRIIDYINQCNIKNKNYVSNIMKENNIENNVILFLLKSFYQGSWRFNFNFIKQNYNNINDWPLHQICQKPILFIKGELSSYINTIGIQNIYKQFPYAHIRTIPNAKHWVHYEYPIHVFNIINEFLR